MADSKFLLSAAFLVAFTQSVLAQDSSTTEDTSSAASSTATSAASSSTEASSSSSASRSSATSTSSESSTSASSSSSVVSTSSITSSATTSESLPTLTNTAATIPSYPAASVPPTNDAPFMHRSSAPDGTVFIAVGAILGTFALAVLLWRGIVACMLHRSVERAARAQALSNDKAAYPIAPAAPFYKYTDHESSSPSLVGRNPDGAAGSASGRGVRRTNRGPIPSGTPSMTNLFYSPTAAPSAGLNTNRESRFLPAGFYASSNSPAPPVGIAQSSSAGQSIGLANLHPDTRNYSRTNLVPEPSPEDSPHFAPQRRDMSSSTLNLNRPSSARTPSAYLDDLLDENPHLFPPQQGQSQSPRQGNASPGQNRF
ncbi:Vacuolar membrane protein [Ceratocystis lukuohia]|uniref:CSI2 protein n=2 Tax=Ceratocystis TaxID=5157 RepID=A0A0F8DDZ1_CERFI|nr:hypothetical protein CFO_g3467 [Ceratocystis platani]